MAALYTNNASTILASGITNSATSLTVQTGNGAKFPNPTSPDYFMCTLQGVSGTPIEIIKVTARSTDTFTIVRAQEGTTASAFNANDIVELRVTAGEMTNLATAGANSNITSLTGLTTALSTAQGGTNVSSAGASGNVLTSNGTNWVSSAPVVGVFGQVFTASGTFTIPSGVTALKVTVVGGGGSGTGVNGSGCCTTVVNGNAGGTSSVSSGTQTISTVSATGGGGGVATVGGTGGLGSGGDLNMDGNSQQAVNSAGGSLFSSAYNSASGAGKSYGGGSRGANGSGAGGGTAIKYLTGLTPSATITVTRGAGGAGATATVPSGAGGNGVIIFEW